MPSVSWGNDAVIPLVTALVNLDARRLVKLAEKK